MHEFIYEQESDLTLKDSSKHPIITLIYIEDSEALEQRTADRFKERFTILSSFKGI